MVRNGVFLRTHGQSATSSRVSVTVLGTLFFLSPGLLFAAAEPQSILVVVQAKDSASKRAAQYMSYGFHQAVSKNTSFTWQPQGPLYGDREIDTKKLAKDAEVLAQDGMTAYDNLETDQAQQKFEQALGLFEQNSGELDSMKPAARYALLAAAVALLNNNDKQARTYMQRALLYDPNAQADPRVYNSQALAVFKDVKAKLAKGPKGSLAVSTNPAYAELYVDGEFIGMTPDKIDRIDAGPHLLRVVRDGFRPSAEVLDVKASKTDTSATLNLIAMPQQQQVAGMIDKAGNEVDRSSSAAAAALATKGGTALVIVCSVSVNGDTVKAQAAMFHANNTRLASAERTFSASTDTYAEEAHQLWDYLVREMPKGPIASTGPAAPPPPPPPVAKKSKAKVPVTATRLTLGGLALAGGATFGVLALMASSDFKTNVVQTSPDVPNRQSDIRTKALVADALLFGGGAIALAGILCLALWDDKPKQQKLGTSVGHTMLDTLRLDVGMARDTAFFGAHGSF
jgi:hypothetical protein